MLEGRIGDRLADRGIGERIDCRLHFARLARTRENSAYICR
jgi:hypothetical protein